MPPLHLTHIATDDALPGGGGRFDDRAWRWLLRDSGELARMTPAEVKLLLLICCLADRHGRCDVPTGWCAEQLGLTPRAVREARKRLDDRRVIQTLTDGTGARRGAKSVVLLMPAAPAPPRGVEGETSGGEVWEPLGGAPLPGGKLRSAGGEAGFPQSCISKEKNKNSGGAAHSAPPGSSTPPAPPAPPAPLYEKPVYDRAAAAVLVDRFGMAPRVAHGLVSQYRPTERQILNVLANIKARDAEAGRDPSVQLVKNRIAFVTAAIKRGDYVLDDRVLEQRRREELRRKAIEAREEREAQTLRDQEQRLVQLEADERLWQSLSAEQRTQLRHRAEQRLPEATRRIHARYDNDAPAVRALILAEARRTINVTELHQMKGLKR